MTRDRLDVGRDRAVSEDRARPIEKPLFVVGAERSGTTLLRLMLDHHPGISFPHQLEFVVDRVGDDGSLPELDAYWQYLETNDIFHRSGFRIDRSLGYMDLVNDFLCQRCGSASVVGGSVHRHLERLPLLWPACRMVHLVRDPRAVARSWVSQGWAGNPWAGVAGWIEIERSWDRLCQQLPPERRLEVRYENLVEDPEQELERICDFVCLRYDPAMLSYPEDSTYSAPVAGRTEEWRLALGDRQQRLVDARLGELLESRSYPSCGHPPLRVGPVLERWLRLEDRLGRIRFRLRRYGWRLFLERYLAQRIGGRGWRERVRARVRSVDARYIQ